MNSMQQTFSYITATICSLFPSTTQYFVQLVACFSTPVVPSSGRYLKMNMTYETPGPPSRRNAFKRSVYFRVVQDDLKVSMQLMITIQKVTSNVQSVPLPFSRHLLTRRTDLSKTVFSIPRSTFRMYSVMAIFSSSTSNTRLSCLTAWQPTARARGTLDSH